MFLPEIGTKTLEIIQSFAAAYDMTLFARWSRRTIFRIARVMVVQDFVKLIRELQK
jgi:hypothetical protein